ncbi:MAG: TolC family protein [Gammaproteobacteria bacterium]
MNHILKLLSTGTIITFASLIIASYGWTQEAQVNDNGQPAREARVFDLKRAIDAALRNHPALATAEARKQAAETGIAAIGAQYRPFIAANALLSNTLAGDRSVIIGNEVTTQAVVEGSFYTSNLAFVAPIVREGNLTVTTLPSERVAKAAYEAVEFQHEVTSNDVISNVTETFYTALSDREEADISKQLVELNRLIAKNERLRFAQNLIPKMDVLSAEASLASAEAALANALTDLATSRRNFAAAIGLDPISDEVQKLELVDKEEPVPPVEALEDLLARARSRHPSILAQGAIVQLAKEVLTRTNSERYPIVDVGLSIGTTDDYDLPTDFWSLRSFARLSWNIFDFGTVNLKVQQQAEVMQVEERALDQIRSEVAQAVIEAHRNFANAQSQVPSAKKAVELQEEVVRNARKQHKQDLIPLADLLRGEAALASAHKSLAQAKYNARIEYGTLRTAIEGL